MSKMWIKIWQLKMKTRLIVLIIIGIIISGSFSFVYAQMYDCLNPPTWIKYPKSDIRYCLGLLANGSLPDYPTSEEYLESKAIKPEPEGGNPTLVELKESGGFIVETRTLRFPERTYTTLANHEDTKNEWFIVNGVLAFGSEMHEVIIPTTLDLYTDDGKVTSVMSYVSLEETIEYAKTLELDSGYIDLNDYVDPNWTDGPTETLDEVPQVEPEPVRTLPPLDKFTLFEDPLFTNPDKFIEVSGKKDSKCFTTPSMNYFCYAKPRMYETGIGVSWLISNTTKVSGELHFDNVNVGPSYFTMKNMTQINGDTAKITFADNNYRIGNATATLYEIDNDFEFTEIIEKFNTFVAKCDNYEGTSVTVVQYLGITTIDSIDYFMTWHTNAQSETGITCDYPQIIQNSFDNDFGNIGYD